MVDVDVHGAVQRADQQGLVGTRSLVGSVDGLGLPISPVNEILKEGEGEDVRDVLAQHCKGERVGSARGGPTPKSWLHTPRTNPKIPRGTGGAPALTRVPVGAVEAGELDVVLPRISPIDPTVDVVEGEAVGPRYLGVNNDAAVGAIHANLPDQGVVTPVCPV